MQRDVHQELVEGAVEERGVDGDDRMQPAGGEPRCGDNRMLLGDPDVPDPVGERLGELRQPDGVQHRRRDRDDVRTLRTDRGDLVPEHRGPRRAAERGERGTGQRVHRTDGVEPVGLVQQRGRVPPALLGEAVHQHRAVEAFRPAERGLDGRDVVPVDRPDVLEPQVLEHALRGEGVLEPLLRAVQRLVQRLSDDGCALEDVLAP